MKTYQKPKLTKHAQLKNITFSEPKYENGEYTYRNVKHDPHYRVGDDDEPGN